MFAVTVDREILYPQIAPLNEKINNSPSSTANLCSAKGCSNSRPRTKIAAILNSLTVLRFHPGKCAMLRVGSKPVQRGSYEMREGDGRKELEWTESQRDLGIVVDSKLSFAEEIGCRVKKANSIVGKKFLIPG